MKAGSSPEEDARVAENVAATLSSIPTTIEQEMHRKGIVVAFGNGDINDAVPPGKRPLPESYRGVAAGVAGDGYLLSVLPDNPFVFMHELGHFVDADMIDVATAYRSESRYNPTRRRTPLEQEWSDLYRSWILNRKKDDIRPYVRDGYEWSSSQGKYVYTGALRALASGPGQGESEAWADVLGDILNEQIPITSELPAYIQENARMRPAKSKYTPEMLAFARKLLASKGVKI